MSAMLETISLSKSFSAKPGLIARAVSGKKTATVHAVNDVSLQVKQGEVLGLVGESGCGKSTLGRMLAGILPSTAGSIVLEGKETKEYDTRDVHLKIQMVFQSPYASLNPRFRIESLLTEAAVYHGLLNRRDAAGYAEQLLHQVGLDPAYASRYPHQFSGGQRQRIAIARALSLNPKLMVCDEPVSALDVSVQAQILNLFMDLRETKGLTYVFISHNLAVVEYLADRVAIMYLGRIVEQASAKELFSTPNHPYTQALLADAPRLDAKIVEHRPIQGELPSPLSPPSGCPFHPRCPHAMDRCKSERPVLKEIAPLRLSACHLNDKA